MNSGGLGPKTQQLLKQFEEIAKMLDDYGDPHWAPVVTNYATQLRNGDLTAISGFLGLFGGMGSLHDLTICPENHHRVTEAETAAVNERLSRTLSEAWNLARMLSGKPV
jgi:hypothetical protein